MPHLSTLVLVASVCHARHLAEHLKTAGIEGLQRLTSRASNRHDVLAECGIHPLVEHVTVGGEDAAFGMASRTTYGTKKGLMVRMVPLRGRIRRRKMDGRWSKRC